MANVPVVEHFQVAVSSDQLARVDRLADELSRDPRFEGDQRFQPLLAKDPAAGPVLCIDDMSAIRIPPRLEEVSFVMDRARLRAGSGDTVAVLGDPGEGYEEYCRTYLGLESCSWLRPRRPEDGRNLARACWQDSEAFAWLAQAVETGQLTAIHPYMGSPDVWELSVRLSRAAGRFVPVLAPPPALSLWANNKVDFASTVSRLFGEEWILPASPASSLAGIASAARFWAPRSRRLGIKLPDSAGGRGNLVLPVDRLEWRSDDALRKELRSLLHDIGWRAGVAALVGPWLKDVACTPSAQLWIPGEGPPVVEGIYVQMLKGEFGEFVGSRPADFSPALSNEIAQRSWLLGRLYQRLGYVGRCSFDLIIQGRDAESGRIFFVECNGRWGGTSIPMTLLNRLWGDCLRRPHLLRTVDLEGLDRLRLHDLLDRFKPELFDVRTGRGRVILFNPSRIKERSGIEVIASGRDLREAQDFLESEFPESLDRLIHRGLTH